MNMNPALSAKLKAVAQRQQRLRLWCRLATCWAATALVGVGILLLERWIGLGSSLALPAVAVLGIVAALVIITRQRRERIDVRQIACQLERHYPDLNGRLLTAVQQEPQKAVGLNYLQERLLRETLHHSQVFSWQDVIPKSRVRIAQSGQWLALLLFGLVLRSLWIPQATGLLTRTPSQTTILVTPGDTNMESGTSLIVLARFNGRVPAKVDLVLSSASTAEVKRIPLARSLADPMFGASVPEVSTNLNYHIEYAGQRTRDYQVTVFEYPRLERADVELTYPAYTGQSGKRIEDTRRLSAVEGSHLDLTLQLNKSVASASLITRSQKTILLQVETNRAMATLKHFPLETNITSELQLVDFEGRTNKVPAQFVFDVLKNRPPELRLASPRGDLRPSALEEIPFEGTVWDDFGVLTYGVAYTVAGEPTKVIELGRSVPQKEKRPFHHVLRLEELGVHADQLLGWYVWAEDVGPDGQVRRTAGDLYFAEVRPFDEVYRESQGMEGQEGQSGEQNESDKLAELQKQIINATWKLQREHGGRSITPAKPEKSSQLQRPKPLQAYAVGSQSHPTLLSLGVSEEVWHLQTAVFGRAALDFSESTNQPARPRQNSNATNRPATYPEDARVVRDSQAQVLDKARDMAGRQPDARAAALWADATKLMDKALEQLSHAGNSPAALAEALKAEQEAYQALLRLQAHEYQVSRSKNRSQSGSSRNQQMQRQLDELDLTQSEDRYETHKQAQNPQTAQRREDLQVMNRLQELARRQQDLNERLKELQTALQEAKNDQEREELQRRLKRLQEEEQQMLSDIDELRQRMDRPENQSRMSEERRQLEQTRNDVQRASEAAAQGEPSQALASGTRAQRQLQDLRDQLKKENSSQFAEDLRQMRAEARELERRQEEIQKQLGAEKGTSQKNLTESDAQKDAIDKLAEQKKRMTNLVEQATQLSQQAEETEPLMSRQLYDSLRKFSQDSGKNVKELQDELLNQRVLTRAMYDRLKDPSQPDGSKLLDITSDLLRQDSLPQAKGAAERTQRTISEFKRGVEKAAESVLGDDTEAMKLAQRELSELTDQLAREMVNAENDGSSTNLGAGKAGSPQGQKGGQQAAQGRGKPGGGNPQQDQPDGTEMGQSSQAANNPEKNPSTRGEQARAEAKGKNPGKERGSQSQDQGDQPGEGQAGQQEVAQGSEQGQPASETEGQSERQGQTQAQAQGQGQNPGQGQGQGTPQGNQPGQNGRQAAQNEAPAPGQAPGGRPDRRGELTSAARQSANPGGGSPVDFNRLLNSNSPLESGPITGSEFGPWSDRLRDVEEMIDLPELRNEVATARDRARGVRQELRRNHKKPDWAVVRSQIMNPLVEVRDRIADELARRESKEALVPIDRDPVPTRYSDLVKKYYENLGKEK